MLTMTTPTTSTAHTPTRIRAPRSWASPASHWRAALESPWYRHLVRVQHRLAIEVHRFFEAHGLSTISLPVTTGSISSPMGLGSDSVPVEVDLMGARTYLADSMQFMLEFGCRLHRGGAYYLMPCFRGERTDETHLPQFMHAEAEICGDLEDVIDLAAGLVHHLAGTLLERCRADIRALAGTTAHVEAFLALGRAIPRVSLDDAIAAVGADDEAFVETHALGFKTLTRKGEAKAAAIFGKADALWITHSPRLAVPFYQADDPGTDRSLNADLILGGRETVGLGERHVDANDVRDALALRACDAQPYDWYVEMREVMPLLTSGFGLGVERFLMWLFRHDDIRDMTVLYRENGVNVVP